MREDYTKAKRLGERAVRRAISEGKYPYLPSLESFLPEYKTLPKYPVGIKEIPLSMIAGTVTEGRQNAFSSDFMPLFSVFSEFGNKWVDLYDSQQEVGIREPIKCYEYMNRFYIIEGNKRVSVMRYLGAYAITADVQRIMPRKTGEKEVDVYYEFVDFYKVTGLYEISFSERGSYAKAADFYGQNLTEEWPDPVIEDIRSDYRFFEKIFLASGGNRIDMTTGDAFLIYMSIYNDAKVSESRDAVVRKRIAGIWNELVSTTHEEEIALVENPDTGRTAQNILSGILGGGYTAEHPLRVAFIYSRDAESSRWIYSHELGRNEIEQRFGGIVETIAFENCDTEEKVNRAFEAANADLDEVVFTTAPDMMDASMRAAIKYPKMKVLNCSINLMSSAVRTYYPKKYEVKFLMGALAASYADDHRIGYVSDYPLNGTIANINAFAIGAALVDPNCKVYLKWSGVKGCDWQKELEEDEGIRVISGPDMIRPNDASRRYGVYKTDESGTVRNLAAPILHWGKFFGAIIQNILDGKWGDRERIDKTQPINYWFGLQSEAVDLIHSDDISYYSDKMLQLFRAGLLSGQVSPFRGELREQNGDSRKPENGELSSSEIILMDWLNDNIIGSIPKREELIDSIQGTLAKSGILISEQQQ